MTAAERLLWQSLRGRTLGAKFRRQASIGPYVVDFVSFERNLVIEVDGGQHADCEGDLERDAWLTRHGYCVLRFWNHEVLKNRTGVLEMIASHLSDPQPP